MALLLRTGGVGKARIALPSELAGRTKAAKERRFLTFAYSASFARLRFAHKNCVNKPGATPNKITSSASSANARNVTSGTLMAGASAAASST
jgi:hypothetical protein